jgi:hypothetical protein
MNPISSFVGAYSGMRSYRQRKLKQKLKAKKLHEKARDHAEKLVKEAQFLGAVTYG